MAGKPNPDGYVHARDDKEYQRLRDQAAMWRPATQAVLDRIGLKPGMSCLDNRRGPGAVMRLMADRVGPKGRVTGIDVDARLGRLALGDLAARAVPHSSSSRATPSSSTHSEARRSISASAGWF